MLRTTIAGVNAVKGSGNVDNSYTGGEPFGKPHRSQSSQSRPRLTGTSGHRGRTGGRDSCLLACLICGTADG